MKSYIKYIRRQSKHIQHIHALVFSGTITALIAAVVLYADYGFWQEKYIRSEAMTAGKNFEETQEPQIDSPGETIGKFFEEAKLRFGGLKATSDQLLEGRQTYMKSATNTDHNTSTINATTTASTTLKTTP